MSRFIPPGLGWQPALADPRDYTLDHSQTKEILAELKIGRGTRQKSVDLREFFPAVEDQGELNSSCAFAVLALFEYFESRTHDPPLEASRLFLYQMSLRLRGTRDDIGVDFRTTIKALRRFGSPPQQFWRNGPGRFGESPVDPFLFCFARDYEQLFYFRLDPASGSRPDRVQLLKSLLAAGVPFLLGVQVPTTSASDGLIYNVRHSARLRGVQAAVAVGFDDALRVGAHKGALLIRNSWGSQWGDRGYGWLPYDLVMSETANESWAMVRADWVAAAKTW